jgi:hypothetical protein
MTPQERARKLRPYIEKAAESLSDDDALAAPELFEHYEVDHFYKKDERFLWTENGKLYKVLQDHTSAAQWRPDESVSLYVEVTPPGVIPVWKQPTGAQDAYMTGDKVHFPDEEGPIYISTVDNNVWAPNVYGWELVQD